MWNVLLQVSDIDVKKDSPCGHGRVTCLSVYCGDDANFAVPGEPPKRQLWVDTLGMSDEVCAVSSGSLHTQLSDDMSAETGTKTLILHSALSFG